MRSTKALVAAAALSGLLVGSAARAAVSTPAPTGSQMASASHRSQSAVNPGANARYLDDSGNKHDCKGKNSCKGEGGCKTGDNGCKGKNSCKGKGGCKTNGTSAAMLVARL